MADSLQLEGDWADDTLDSLATFEREEEEKQAQAQDDEQEGKDASRCTDVN